jgi:hypothetical protein
MTTAPGLRSVSALTIAVVAVVAAGGVSAHRLDELLQATRIGIADDRVDLELDLTPGIAVAGAIVNDIDGDHDGTLSEDEQRAYVSRVLQDVRLAADGHVLPLKVSSFAFPSIEACRDGLGVIGIRATTPLTSTRGAHTLTLSNEYHIDDSAFLANALVPDSDRIAIHAQRRDGAQSELAIDYSVADRPHAALPYAGLTVVIALVTAAARKSLFE